MGISKEINQNKNEVKEKMDSLLASSWRERQCEASSGHLGAGSEQI